MRLFCVGAYFFSISEFDIFKFIAKERNPTEDNFKIFSRSLWVEGFSQSMEPFKRNYRTVWESLCNYERDFFVGWWSKLYDEGIEEFIYQRKANHIKQFMQETK
jgi:hypothetical protein